MKTFCLFGELITGVSLGFEFVEEDKYNLFVVNLLIVRIILEYPK